MAKEDNLKKFTSEYQPQNNGRPKGSKNRSTIARYWLEVNQNLKNPLTGENETMSQEDLMTLALIKKAREGDVNAYKALMDSGYGAPVQQVEQTQTNIDLSGLSTDEIKDLLKERQNYAEGNFGNSVFIMILNFSRKDHS
jgi:hypothetical protein